LVIDVLKHARRYRTPSITGRLTSAVYLTDNEMLGAKNVIKYLFY